MNKPAFAEPSSIRLYVCHEPDDTVLAARLDAWPRTNGDVNAYNARVLLAVDHSDSARVRDGLATAIRSARVFVCIVSQATLFDPWVAWEIEQATQAQGPGLVCVLTHDGDPPPPGLQDRGAIFVRFQRDQIERAIEWQAKNPRNRDDFRLSDELE